MAIQKQAVNVPFALGLDTKTDDKQVSLGKFLALANSVFDKQGLLQKRNGYGHLASLPDATNSYLTTFTGNLTAIGTSINAYNEANHTWISKGQIQPLSLSTLPLIRNNVNQLQVDTAVAPNGLVCTAYTEFDGSTTSYKYAVADSVTGQNILAPAIIPAAESGTINTPPRVFVVGNYFIILFGANVSGSEHLHYFPVALTSPSTTLVPVEISGSFAKGTQGVAFDGTIGYSGNLYIAWNGGAFSGIRATYLDVNLALASSVILDAAHSATIISLASDVTVQNLWVSYYDSATSNAYTLLSNQFLTGLVLGPTQFLTTATIANLTTSSSQDLLEAYYEVSNSYSYDSSIPTNFIAVKFVSSTGIVGPQHVVKRSVGLASKVFWYNGKTYLLSVYSSPFQPTYFLLQVTGNGNATLCSKLAYSNGGGYLTLGLPGVSLNDSVAQIGYLFKDLVEAQAPASIQSIGLKAPQVYSQTGINLSSFSFGTATLNSVEIGNILNLTGGFVTAYDGYLPVESGFFVWPDSVEVTGSTMGGSLTAQQYYYVATYEWTDNQGNAIRSAPSLPVTVTNTGSTSSNIIDVPSLRLTEKTANPVKIVIYRWSTANQVYYQVTSITSPLLNPNILTIDSVSFIDTQADSAIVGNNILYTTGGVIENISPPATDIMTLFDNRLWLVDSEDRNLLWFSKQVIEATPVEMSDLSTIYVAPTIAAQGSTGPITALSAMDDKLIIFKKDAIYYINGTGPDNTDSDNQYSQPIFVTSNVGCADPRSIVLTPQGLQFQSDKGIWLLGRGLDTQYIGSPVEEFTQFDKEFSVQPLANSAVSVPGTNQIRFTMSTGSTLMYDTYYGQWGTFTGVPAVASTLFQGMHTYIDKFGRAYQETQGLYLDGSNPVLMNFTTSWLNLAGLQGYQRAYFFYLLGTFITPHKLQLGIAYDYNPAVTQVSTISPTNYSTAFGAGPSQSPFGQGTPFGGPSTLENWRVFLAQQRCQAFQITLQELYDGSQGVPAGAGLTLSGITIVTGFKKGFRPIGQGHSVGGGQNSG